MDAVSVNQTTIHQLCIHVLTNLGDTLAMGVRAPWTKSFSNFGKLPKIDLAHPSPIWPILDPVLFADLGVNNMK